MSIVKSFYSQNANIILKDNLISQYDMENKIPNSCNQCSWYVYCVINNIKKNNWVIDIENIEKLHVTSLEEASLLRSLHRKVEWGESIFSKTIQSKFNISIGSPYTIRIGDCLNNNYLENVKMKEIIKFKLNLPIYSSSELYKKIKEILHTNTYLLINRHGQSFLIYPNEDNYIIFDSHTREIGIFDIHGVYKYIMNNSSDNLIVCITGYMKDLKLDSKTFDDMLYLI
jgi:hypothetical protein